MSAAPWREALALLAIVAAGLMLRILWPSLPRQMRLAVSAYVVAITMMAVAAATVNPVLVPVGAVLFMISDALLAIERFRLAPDAPQRAWTRPSVWAAYYAAQLLITVALLV